MKIKCLFDPPPIRCIQDKGMEVKIYSSFESRHYHDNISTFGSEMDEAEFGVLLLRKCRFNVLSQC